MFFLVRLRSIIFVRVMWWLVLLSSCVRVSSRDVRSIMCWLRLI